MNGWQWVRDQWRGIRVPAQILLLSTFLLGAVFLRAQDTWTIVGPAGGDARALISFPGEPKHLLLGTTNSWLYESVDEGASWHRLAKLGSDDGFVLDSIVVDSVDPATGLVRHMEQFNRRRIVDQPRRGPDLERAGTIQRPAGARSGAGAFRPEDSLCWNIAGHW